MKLSLLSAKLPFSLLTTFDIEYDDDFYFVPATYPKSMTQLDEQFILVATDKQLIRFSEGKDGWMIQDIKERTAGNPKSCSILPDGTVLVAHLYGF